MHLIAKRPNALALRTIFTAAIQVKRFDKAPLRARFKKYRTSLVDTEYVDRCRQIVVRLSGLSQLRRANTVHVYWPQLSSREINLRPLIAYLRACGKTVVLPVVDFQASKPHLRHHTFTSERDLTPNKWGILEPQGTPEVRANVIDTVIAPALGLDRRGYRIGYGGGYYDVLLSTIEAAIVCPVFAACVVDELPVDDHDMRVHVTVTEFGSINHMI